MGPELFHYYEPQRVLLPVEAFEFIVELFLAPLLLVAVVLYIQRRRNPLSSWAYLLAFLVLLPALTEIAFSARVPLHPPPYDALYVDPGAVFRAAQHAFIGSLFTASALLPALIVPTASRRLAQVQLGIAVLIGGTFAFTPVASLRLPFNLPLISSVIRLISFPPYPR